MNVEWQTLELIANTEKLDVWYLFPIGALIRCLKKNGKINPSWITKITKLLGTENWKTDVYKVSNQCNMFDEIEVDRDDIENVLNYVQKRLKILFSGVCEKPKRLETSKNSLLFGLFFMCSNPNLKAIELSLKIADYILKNK